MERWVCGMRDAFFDSLYKIAKDDPRVILITSDTGAICHNNFRKDLKHQYLNVGIAEQNLVGVAAGLAMAGKIIYIYAIVPFVTMRCYEQIRIDLCYMNLPVTIVSIGAGYDYSTLGPTHHGTEDIALMRVLPGMTIFSPSDSIMSYAIAGISYKLPGPKYIRLDRTGFPLIYKDKKEDFLKGMTILRRGGDICIVATGRMTYRALEVAKRLSAQSIQASVVDLHRIKPLNKDLLFEIVSKSSRIVTLEEHFITGGIGSIIAEMLIDEGSGIKLKRFGIPNQFCRRCGDREYLQDLVELSLGGLTKSLVKWVNDK